MRTFYLFMAVVLLSVIVTVDSASAQQPDRARHKPNVKASGMTKAREAAAMAFVREHHPELEALLIQLKQSQPKQYEQAVRDLFRTSERLAAFLERDPQRHDLELQAWQTKSRVQLLSATLLMSPSDKETASKLKKALLEEAEIRRKILAVEQERLSRRLQRVESQIEMIDKNAERIAERQINALLNLPKQKSSSKTSTSQTN